MTYEQLKQAMRSQKAELTNSERSKLYSAGEEVDFLPFGFNSPDSALLPLYGFSQQQFRESLEVKKELIRRKKEDFDLEGISLGMSLKGIGRAVGSKIGFPENDIEYIEECILTDYDQLERMEIIQPQNVPFMVKTIETGHRLKEVFPEMSVRTSVAGPMTTAISIRKVEDVLRDIIRHPQELKRLLQFSVDCSLAWVQYVKNEFGNISCSFADPATSQNLISWKNFQIFSKPYMKRLFDGIQEITGKKPSVHICGKTKKLWPDLIDIGVENFSIDDCEDLAEAKSVLGNDMLISGNVPPTTILRYGSIDDVIANVRECIEKASDSPCGFQLNTGCQVAIGTPRENIDAYIYAARKYGRGAQKGHLCKGLEDI
ncbi:uroporphyrinogen decarboxylase [Lachnospiraceae bacterium KGMB03038]|nr:uroporphyrinogen decarboxylase [Lachnospiraceae bacterium KGMB03038]